MYLDVDTVLGNGHADHGFAAIDFECDAGHPCDAAVCVKLGHTRQRQE
jgi:hypothetical protein